jgi:membrane-bound lytic murein transglycosylase B
MRYWLALFLLLATTVSAVEISAADEQRLQQLSADLQIPLFDLQQAMAQAQLRQPVLDAIQKPWEAKPWYIYRPLFITEARIANGVAFWRQHADALNKAERQLHVPAELIVAIIGVETRFGSQMGDHPVLDALYTLGFHYPARAPYFSKEFAQYVKLARQQGWSLREPKGSYAGAMGMGQFMPTSYLHFAVDFDGDGHIDLFANPTDAIGSVGNYFAEHGWHWGEPVAHRAQVRDAAAVAHLLDGKLEINQSWEQLQTAGVSISTALDPATPVKLLTLDQATGPEYWVLRNNFYVITRYNRSPLYAMAVHQLSEKIAAAYHDQ